MTTADTATFPYVSREYVWVPVKATGDDANLLTTLPVAMAFLTDRTAEPDDTDWHSGSWSDSGAPVARCLIGPSSGTVLAKGTWWVWVRVTGGIEEPIRQAGKLKIT